MIEWKEVYDGIWIGDRKEWRFYITPASISNNLFKLEAKLTYGEPTEILRQIDFYLSVARAMEVAEEMIDKVGMMFGPDQTNCKHCENAERLQKEVDRLVGENKSLEEVKEYLENRVKNKYDEMVYYRSKFEQLLERKDVDMGEDSSRKRGLLMDGIERYKDAIRNHEGWCTKCKEFTCIRTEPDARGYECPKCGQNTVYGIEEAILEGFLS